jgi:nitronate monooxygenase
MWPDRRILDLFKIESPILLAPMAGVIDAEIAIAVAEGGGLASIPCAMISAEKAREQVNIFRQRVRAPINLNFFCHTAVDADPAREAVWRRRLAPFYRELGLDPDAPINAANRAPFDAAFCDVVEELRPEVVSFHFGLPEQALLKRVKATGAIVLASATIVREAVWLEQNGADVIIAQGAEAGGHRGMFLSEDLTTQVGTVALLPQVVKAVRMPVVAAGGIADATGVAAALSLGAAGVQLGTAYLLCPEAKTSAVHRAALKSRDAWHTALTNLFSGRPARGIMNRLMTELGPLNGAAPAFPLAANALAPLRRKAESAGVGDFSPMWAGQNVSGCKEISAADLTRTLIR